MEFQIIQKTFKEAFVDEERPMWEVMIGNRRVADIHFFFYARRPDRPFYVSMTAGVSFYYNREYKSFENAIKGIKRIIMKKHGHGATP